MSNTYTCIVCGKQFEWPYPKKICSQQCDSIFKSNAMRAKLQKRWSSTPYKSKLSEQALDVMHQYNNIHDTSLKQLVTNILDQIGQSYQLDYTVDGVTYDISIPSLQMVMCVDASVNNVAFRDVEDSIYIHRDDSYLKSKHAADHGLRCVHWYDWDDVFKLPLMLSNPVTVYARNCTVAPVDISESNLFMNMYHLQKARNGVKVSLGLFHENDLVQVMTFGHPRFNRNYEWELYRFCSDPTVRIVGGASKLFKHFVQQVNPESIITYCDAAKFTGSVYEKMGMKFRSFTTPSIIWSRGAEQMSNNVLSRFRYDGLFGTNYGKDASNQELMILNGWLPVYNCGQYTYEWHKQSPCI